MYTSCLQFRFVSFLNCNINSLPWPECSISPERSYFHIFLCLPLLFHIPFHYISIKRCFNSDLIIFEKRIICKVSADFHKPILYFCHFHFYGLAFLITRTILHFTRSVRSMHLHRVFYNNAYPVIPAVQVLPVD